MSEHSVSPIAGGGHPPVGSQQEEADMTVALDTSFEPVAGGDDSRSDSLIGFIGAEAACVVDFVDIDATLAGNEGAYARLMQRYEGEIARQMWRFTRDLNERDELVQEVFVEAYLGLRRYRRKAPFLHWLRTIAVRRGFRFWKQREKKKLLVPLEDWDGARRESPPQTTSLAAEQLFALLQRLKPEERVVMTLEYVEERSVEDIAHLLGWTKPMVKMRAYRARKKLRGMYERLQGWEVEL